MTNLTLDEIEQLSFDALIAVGTSEGNARAMAKATRETEADGIASHGLAYIPIYASHVACGKVDGQAVPELLNPSPALLRVDAKTGFAHPAIALGFDSLISLAKSQGMAGMAVFNSYNCGVLGVHTRRLAEAGLVGIGFTNAPASILPSGGHKPVLGTNPFSIAVPNMDGKPAILIDQSASAIAKSEIAKHARENKPIPLGWALDPDGNPTTDAALGLKGSMVPSGGYKGVGLALFVELMAATLTGAHLGSEASSFATTEGGSPKTGQFFIAIAPDLSSGGGYGEQIQKLMTSINAQDGAHLPGQGRFANRQKSEKDGVAVSPAVLDKIHTLIAQKS